VADLPIASRAAVRAYARLVIASYPREAGLALLAHALTAAAALVGPWLLGNLVQEIQSGVNRVTTMVALIVGFLVLYALIRAVANYLTARLAEKVIADLRESFISDVLALPLARIEDAGVGDLVTRSTRDVDALAQAARVAVPGTLVALTTMAIMFGAILIEGWLMIIPCLLAIPFLWPVTRWYLSRARDGYLRERASYAGATETLSETIAGSRTVESLRLAPWRAARLRDDVTRAYDAERFTLGLRSVFLPITDTAIAIPTIGAVILGGYFYNRGWVSLAAVSAVTLYTQQLAGLIDTLLYHQDKLQVAGASVARLLGVSDSTAGTAPVPGAAVTRRPAGVPAARDIEVRDVSYGYSPGRDVLHGVSFTVREGERITIVGPTGAGKTTLGRLLAGIDRPRAGSVTVGGVPLAEIPRSELRSEIALVTQEYYFFQGSVRDNLLIGQPAAGDDEIRASLEAVAAWRWVSELGLDTRIEPGVRELSPAEAQQVSLARLLLTDPHTLVLDEATSLLNPRLARDLERSLAAVMAGRTVISIAHRLNTAYDADRILVMAGGRIIESGSHQDLIAAGGSYAASWSSWQSFSSILT
jgi:ABC-type multidrug transport system fused ATPase/permease subunit